MCPELNSTVYLRIDDVTSICHRSLRNLFSLFPDLQVDWKEIYLLALKVSIETKIGEFQ